MKIHPEIAALRDDRDSQRRFQRRLEGLRDGWIGEAANQPVFHQLQQFGQGAPLSKLHDLRQLLCDADAAMGFVHNWQSRFLGEIAQIPLGHIPFRHNYSPGFATIRLRESDRATLSLLAYEEVEQQAVPRAAAFSDREQYEIVITGEADCQFHSLEGDQNGRSVVRSEARRLSIGDTVVLTGQNCSRQIHNVRGRLLVLQLSRSAQEPGPTREIGLADGSLIHKASGSKRDSQISMAMAVLTELGRTDAAPHYARIANDGPDHLRWDAVRHTLTLDPVRGFTILGEIARDPNDELAQPASALRQQLATAHPQLLQLEAQQCPA